MRALLTPYPFKLLQSRDTLPDLLAILTATAATPLVLWTAGMRAQLQGALEPQLEGSDTEGSGAVLAALEGWAYDDLRDELVVEDVYVRLYCEVRQLFGG